ncbi:MAG: hypothetical protein GAK30_00436 [Paracidovorax wautersii]|uniref:Uncharacterized protein n=1 Tax=Paracidovorax wautersii TaxID=1177982 RepID=A0A7V8FRZ8_9BURK|nr:MAG: hypothetical protein GAK30_00436 [Paracidovorax wautersii]
MDNTNCRSPGRQPPRPEVIDLYVKDGVREMRLNLRAGAHRLQAEGGHVMRVLEERLPGPLARIGESVEKAMGNVAHALDTVDRRAEAWLTTSPWRDLGARWPSSASYFNADSTGAGPLRAFTHDHYWRYRHWLALRGQPDMLVREHAIAEAALRTVRQAGPPDAAAPQPWLAALIATLAAAPILRAAEDTPEHPAPVATLAWQAALTSVLAGELRAHGIAASGGEALRLADEIVQSTQPHWQHAAAAAAPADLLQDWLRFSLKHA